MKNGEVVEAKTHAEFLNKAFGTNYKAYMKCVWNYDEDWIVWMVRFNIDGVSWKNTFISDSRIKEENTNLIQISYIKPLSRLYKKRIVFEIVDLGYTRKYIYRGRFIYDEKNSDPYKVRYYDKYSD